MIRKLIFGILLGKKRIKIIFDLSVDNQSEHDILAIIKQNLEVAVQKSKLLSRQTMMQLKGNHRRMFDLGKDNSWGYKEYL